MAPHLDDVKIKAVIYVSVSKSARLFSHRCIIFIYWQVIMCINR